VRQKLLAACERLQKELHTSWVDPGWDPQRVHGWLSQLKATRRCLNKLETDASLKHWSAQSLEAWLHEAGVSL
jgi:hypothetical protein